MKKEYDFNTSVRGKYAKKYAAGHNLIRIDPELEKHFPDSESVNYALHSLVDAVGHGQRSVRKPHKRVKRTAATRR